MGDQVPLAEQSIGYDAPQATIPDEAKANPAAFGINVGEALAKGGAELGARTEQIYQRKMQLDYYRNQEDAANASTQYRTQLQNKLFGDGTVTVKDKQGNDIEIPSGLMNRMGHQADNNLVEYDQYATELKKKLLEDNKSLGIRGQRYLLRLLDNDYASVRGTVATHSAQQYREGQKQSMNASLSTQAQQGVLAQNPLSLGLVINGIKDTNQKYSDMNGDDETVAELRQNKFVSLAVKNSLQSVLKTSGDLNKAYSLLDSVKDNISPEVYEKQRSEITSASKIIAEAQQRQDKLNKIGNGVNLFQAFADGKLSWSNADDISSMAGKELDSKMAQAISSVLLNPSRKQALNSDDKAFANVVSGILNSESKQDVHDKLVALFKEGNSDMSLKHLQIIAKMALDKGNSLNGIDKNEGVSQDSQKAVMEGVYKSLIERAHALNLSASNMISDVINNPSATPHEAYIKAFQAEIARKFPKTATMENPPTQVFDGDHRFVIHPSVEPGTVPMMFDPKAGRIVPNPNYKQKRPSKDASSNNR